MPSKKKKDKLLGRMTTAGMGIASSAEKVVSDDSSLDDTPMKGSLPPAPFSLPVDKIEPNPEQPRTHIDQDELRELADTIKSVGVLQPVVVTPKGDGIYTLVVGHRRWHAAKLAGLDEIPAVVREANDLGKLALIENLQRSDLSPLEEATALGNLREQHGYTQERLAAELGKKRTWVTESLGLLRLPDAILQELLSPENRVVVSKSTLIEISRHKTEEAMLEAWESLKRSGVTVAKARAQKKPRSSQLDKFTAETGRYQERVAKLLARKLETPQLRMIRDELEVLRSYIDEQLKQLPEA